ncbi:hypothetical protein ACFL2Q_03050 [Thermodesulfobacteriota bacterium]
MPSSIREDVLTLVVDLRHSRLRVLQIVPEGGIVSLADFKDEPTVRGDAHGNVAVRLEPEQEGNTDSKALSFANLVQRANSRPFALDLSPLLDPVVRELLSAALESQPHQIGCHVYYLIPFNSSENLWGGLPKVPFELEGRFIEPIGFMDEILITLASVGTNLNSVNFYPPGDILILTMSDSSPILLHGRYESRDGHGVATLEGAFRSASAGSCLPGKRSSRVIIGVSGQPALLEEAAILCESLSAGNGKIEILELPPMNPDTLLLDYFFGDRQSPVRLVINDYSGVTFGQDASFVTARNPVRYPCTLHRAFDVTHTAEGSRMGFFRGHFADPEFCSRLRPVDLDTEVSAETYMISMKLTDRFRGCANVLKWRESPSEAFPVLKRDISIPPPLFGEG